MLKNLERKTRRSIFNLHKFFIYFSFATALLSSCSSLPNRSDANSLATKAALQAARPTLEKTFFAESPILPASQSRFPFIDQLPGKADFNPFPYQKKSISYDSDGTLLLSPGDYSIPVMTYCMNIGGMSPAGYTYALASLQGTRAQVIREINIKAVPQFSAEDVQILSWSLQAGLRYDEMTDQSRRIIGTVIPERKNELQESFLQRFENKWNEISEHSDGLIPSFGEASENLFSDMGEVGKDISEMRNFRTSLQEFGNDYSSLKGIIDSRTTSEPAFQKTPWSKISDRVYARFVTQGHFQELGQIQIRVLPPLQKRNPSSTAISKTPVDLSSWLADPRNLSIQPLSFSIIVGSQGMILIPELAEAPLLAAAALGAILANEVINWHSFYQLSQLLVNVTDTRVRELIQEGTNILHEGHDELEKPARDLGIITNKTEKTPNNEKNETREYIKPGGEEALQKDFDKFPGEVVKAKDGTEMKILSDGATVVKRPITPKNQLPTLEIQAPKGNIKEINGLRIKVRYPKQ
jgi:hypothetical protein